MTWAFRMHGGRGTQKAMPGLRRCVPRPLCAGRPTPAAGWPLLAQKLLREDAHRPFRLRGAPQRRFGATAARYARTLSEPFCIQNRPIIRHRIYEPVYLGLAAHGAPRPAATGCSRRPAFRSVTYYLNLAPLRGATALRARDHSRSGCRALPARPNPMGDATRPVGRAFLPDQDRQECLSYLGGRARFRK